VENNQVKKCGGSKSHREERRDEAISRKDKCLLMKMVMPALLASRDIKVIASWSTLFVDQRGDLHEKELLFSRRLPHSPAKSAGSFAMTCPFL
jgi:hypothetical protein